MASLLKKSCAGGTFSRGVALVCRERTKSSIANIKDVIKGTVPSEGKGGKVISQGVVKNFGDNWTLGGTFDS